LIDAARDSVKASMSEDLKNTSYMQVLLLKQLLEQVDNCNVDMRTDLGVIEDGSHVRQVEQYEEAILSGREATLNMKLAPRKAASLPGLGGAADPATAKEMMQMQERLEQMEARYLQMQQQCTNVLKQKTEMGAELQACKLENESLREGHTITHSDPSHTQSHTVTPPTHTITCTESGIRCAHWFP